MARLPARVPCPFCGEQRVDVKRQQHFGEWFWCQCPNCGAQGPRVPSQALAISGWNGAEVRKLPPKVLREVKPPLQLVASRPPPGFEGAYFGVEDDCDPWG